MANAIFKSLNEVIDSLYIGSLDEDSYLSDVKRPIIQMWARKGLREFITKETASMQHMRLDVVNNRVRFPDDFVRLLSLSKINDCGTLTLLATDKKIPVANKFLLDDNGVILLDESGVQLTGDGDSDIDRTGGTCYNYDTVNPPVANTSHVYNSQYYNSAFDYYNINPKFARGISFNIDIDKGVIQFFGEAPESVVLGYVYDPTKNVGVNEELEIHSLFALALEDWVYSRIVAKKRSVPLNEKLRAAKEAKKSLLEAKLAKNTPSVQEIMRVTNLK